MLNLATNKSGNKYGKIRYKYMSNYDDENSQPPQNSSEEPFQAHSRINNLIDRYLDLEYLSDRLADLPLQFIHPQPRAWQPIYWQGIDSSQIIGLRSEVFLSVLKGAAIVEEPIRSYAQVSAKYLNRFHQPMARFVGGKYAEDGRLLEMGLWEKEERQHTPTLAKIYKQLTGTQLVIKPMKGKPYQPSDRPHTDMFRHGLHRTITEYGATCLYLWLMAHSTGALQQVLSELLLDEINHMTKFLGFGIWAFSKPDKSEESYKSKQNLSYEGTKSNQSKRSPSKSNQYPFASIKAVINTFSHVMNLVDWQIWHPLSKLELTYTFLRVMFRLWRWKDSLSSVDLDRLFGKELSPLVENSTKH